MNRKNHLLAILAAVSFILATLTGCGGKTEPDVPQPTQKPVEYANLTDEDSRALLSRLLGDAGIDETRIRGLFDRVDQFNASVKSEWLTNGFERAVPTDTKYDPYEMQDLWAENRADCRHHCGNNTHQNCSVKYVISHFFQIVAAKIFGHRYTEARTASHAEA